jgi:hypothetical protein
MHKKIYHILSAALLLFATTGTGISKHYCGEFWVSTSIYGEGDTCCNNSNCCHTENQFFQVEDDFSAPGFSQIPLVVDLNLLACLLEQESNWYIEKEFADFIIQKDLHPPSDINTLLALNQAWLL